MDRSAAPEKTSPDVSLFELEYWEKYGGLEKYDLHLSTYRRLFPLDELDFGAETILDVGSGAVSIFEKLAPADAAVLPYDILAEDYNRIAPDKKFLVRAEVSQEECFSLITMFNMIDHVNDPEDLLRFVVPLLRPNGRVWLCTHLGQPHGPEGHPQNFSCSSLVDLISRSFRIEACGVVREGIPVPYLWYGVLLPLSAPSGRSMTLCKIHSELVVFRLHAVRALVKALKLMGLRRLLPEMWRF